MKQTPNSQRTVFVLSFLDYVLDMFRRFNQCLGMDGKRWIKTAKRKKQFSKSLSEEIPSKLNASSCIIDISFLSWVEILVLLKVLDRINMTVFSSNIFTTHQQIYSSWRTSTVLFPFFSSFPVVSWEYLLLLLIFVVINFHLNWHDPLVGFVIVFSFEYWSLCLIKK